MKNNRLKMLLAGMLLAGTIFVGESAATEAVTYKDALQPISESVAKEHLTVNTKPMSGALPSSKDLSTSKYFPAIRSQGRLGSCSAFATIYYQFTYEANKLNNINSKDLNNCYSPKWVYNSINSGVDKGSSIEKAYGFLKDYGSMRWKDLPYDDVDYSSLPDANYANQMREALNCRLSEWNSYIVQGSGTVITNNKDGDLDIIKTLLVQGHPLVIGTYNKWDIRQSGTWGKVAVSCMKKDSGHAMTVVGYNDNVWVDVNGNGKKDAGECGAFKLANSWGTNGTGTNNGFMWVLYDALNGQSSISGDWQQSGTVRVPAFAFGKLNNYFYSITVENKDVEFVAEVNLSADKLSQLQLSYNRSQKNTGYCAFGNYSINQPTAYSGVVMMDIGNVMDSIVTNYTGYLWYMNVRDTSRDNYAIRNISYKITDNLGKTIQNGGTVTSVDGTNKIMSAAVNLLIGDVDYSGCVDSDDAVLVLKNFAGTETFSNVQKFLGDCNGDGNVDSDDAQLILSAFAGL